MGGGVGAGGGEGGGGGGGGGEKKRKIQRRYTSVVLKKNWNFQKNFLSNHRFLAGSFMHVSEITRTSDSVILIFPHKNLYQ